MKLHCKPASYCVLLLALALGHRAWGADGGGVAFPLIDRIQPRGAAQIAASDWSIGGETLDRDFADYERYKEYLGRLGAKGRAQAQSLQWLLPLCRAAGITRLVINGSFVTDAPEPNDVDCVLLQGAAYNEASRRAIELEQGLPFLSLQIVRQEAFDYLAGSFFVTDRAGVAKGVVEVHI